MSLKTDSRGAEGPGQRRRPLQDRLSFGLWRSRPLVSVVRLSGVIGLDSLLRPGLTLAHVAPVLARAFAPKHQAAVALVINSPGGSPVQSSLIAGRIRDLAEETETPVLAFIEDVAASGGYWLACAADEIFADPSSIVGSIGVISAGFGFHDLIGRFGIERRVHTAGHRKMMLDPFQPQSPEDVERLKTIQTDIHEQFKALVRARRGARLQASEAELFSGEFWVGTRAGVLGLVDGVGSVRSLLRARYGERVRMRMIAPDRRWWRRRSEAGIDLSAGMIGELVRTVEERIWWARYGL